MKSIALIPKWGMQSPAAIEHDGVCEEVYINPFKWILISPEQKRFIIEHELAHCKHNVYDELSADRIGYQNFVAKGGNPKAAMDAILDHTHPQDSLRTQRVNQMNALSQFRGGYFPDPVRRNQVSHYTPLQLNGPSIPGFEPTYGGMDFGTAPSSTPSDAPRKGWNAGDWADIIGAVGGVAGNVFGKNPQYPGYPGPTYEEVPPRGLSTTTMVLIGLAVVAVIVILLMRR